MTIFQNQRQSLIECVRRWGGVASNAVLEPNCNTFTTPSIEGMIGYRLENQCAVVFGDPVCNPEDIPSLTKAFHEYCQKNDWSISYLMTSQSFATWAIGHVCEALIEYGEELVVNPILDDPRKGAKGSLVRRKVKQAIKGNVIVREYKTPSPEMNAHLEEVSHLWLQNRHGPQVFISTIRLFEDPFGKRWFYALQGDKIIGIAIITRLEASQGWLLGRLMTLPDAPNGTPELLVVSLIETLKQEHCPFLSFGVTPSKELGKIEGLNKATTWITYFGYNTARFFFHLDRKKTFWKKFQPKSLSAYLLFNKPKIGFKELIGLKQALNMTLSA